MTMLTHSSVAVTAAASIPAIAWFFMGRSPQTTEQKGAAMKDARETGAPVKGPGPAGGDGVTNEEPSKSVPADQPPTKGTKMANPKAVSGDNERLGTEVSLAGWVACVWWTGWLTILQRASKANNLTGSGKGQ